MKLKGNSGYLAAMTLMLSLGILVLWEFWLEGLILVDYLDIEVNKNNMDRWTFIVSCLSIVCLSLVLPFQSMKSAVDEMKALETALHGEQTLSKVFFTVDNSIILVIDTSNKIMQINQKTVHTLGFKEEELLGQDWISSLVPEKSRDAIKNQYKHFTSDKNQNFIRFSAPIVTKGGSEKMIDWQCSPLKDERGQVYGSINSGQDISEPMRLRNELSSIKGKFEPQIKKLTADLDFNKKKYHSEAIKSANARARFKFWFDLESALIDLSPQEINSPEEINKRIKQALQLFGEMTNVDQGYVFKFTQDNTHMSNTHLWVSGEPLLEPDPSESASLDSFKWFKKKILSKEILHLPKITEMPKEASSEKEAYLSQGIRSLINAPIFYNDSVVGYLGFESNQKEKSWDQDEINVIKVLGRLISTLTHTSATADSHGGTNIPAPIDGEIELGIPGLSMEDGSPNTEPAKTSSKETNASIEKELKVAKAALQKEFKEKINGMEQEKSSLMAELQERKQVESDLRENRDSIERQLGEKSLELEKLLAEAGAGSDKGGLKIEGNVGSSGPASKHGKETKEEIQKENEVMRNALQKKEAEMATMRTQLKTKVGGLTASEIEDYKNKISEKDSEISSLRKNYEETKSSKTELENQLSQIQAAISDEGTETDSLNDKLEDTQQELENLEIANEQLMTDIEERDFLIEEAKEKAARYEQMDLPLFTLDQEGLILTWNKTAAKLTGYISELALETPITFMLAEKDEFDLENELLAPLRENSNHRLEIQIKKATGAVFNALISLVSFKDRNGVLSTLGYFVNLSDADNAEDINSIKKQFTTLLGNSGLYMVHLSPEYGVTDMNEKAENTFSWERDAAMEQNFFEMALSGDDWEDTFNDIQGRMATGENVNLETHSKLPDENQHTFLWSLIREIDPKDESVKGILAIAQDVTQLHSAQNQLRENDFILNLIVDKANDGLIVIDDNGIIQSFNEGAEKMFGYTSHDIIGKNVSQLMPDPYRKEHDNYIKKYMDTGESNFVGGAPKELIGKNKNGSTFPMEITLRETYQGYQRMFVGVARDIRKRKETEIKLVESQEKYHRFMEAETNAVLIINGNTKQIMECNPAAPNIYGYDREEFLALNFKNLIAEADQRSNGDTSLTQPGLGSTQKITQLYQKKKDGTLFPASVTTSSFRSKDIDYELKIISDTSAKVQLDENQHKKDGLRKTYRENKISSLEHITSAMVDLVNNPIQGIQNILEQVKERAEMTDIHKGLVTVAMNECRRVAQLISQLKNYQPPSTEELEPLDVHQVIDDILRNNMETLQDRTITLEKEYADGLPAIDGVNQQIRQAINNIIKNAEESFDDEEGKITISTERDGSNIKIHIKDTGCGILEKDLDRIFDPFYTTKSAIHRPGLGLLSSLGIIKNHQGDIDVHSEPGAGTTFTVTLPLKQPVEPNNGQS